MSVERLTSKYTLCNVTCGRRIFIEKDKLAARLAIIENILGEEYDLDRLGELVQADRKGRCAVLPCKVGDVLYSAFPLCGVNKHQVRKFERNSEGDFVCSALMIPISDFGKRVFLTREAAEAALKGERDG